jgi:hypothetical protein
VYSAVIREIAREQQTVYLPLNESLTPAVEREPRKNTLVFKGPERALLYKAIVSHYLLSWSWDEIAEQNGFLFLTDFIHLNNRGGGIAAELIEAFVRNN